MTSLLARHAPTRSEDVLLRPVETVEALRTWLASARDGVAMVTAPRGSGATTLLRLLTRELGMEPIWLAASMVRNKAFLADCASSAVTVDFRRKVIVCDEYDAVAGDAGLQTDLVSFLRKKPPVPVVLASQPSRSSKTLEFSKNFATFALTAASPDDLAAYLRGACPDADCKGIATRARGDVRAAFSELTMRLGTTKDECAEGLDALEKIAFDRPTTVRGALAVFSQDPPAVSMGLYENYPALSTAVETTETVSRFFSDADVFENHLYSTQCWDLADVYGVLTAAAPALHLPPPSKRLKKLEKFGTIWSKLYNQAAKRKHVHDITRSRVERSACASIPETDLAYLRAIVSAGLVDHDPLRIREVCDAACLGAPEVLSLMRLWKTEYKQSAHARVKKALALA